MKIFNSFLFLIPKIIESKVKYQNQRRNNAPSTSITLISTPTTIINGNPSNENNIILPPSLDGVIVVPSPNAIIFPDMNFPPSFLDLSIPNTDNPTGTSSGTLYPTHVVPSEPTKNHVLETSPPTKEEIPSPTNIPVVVSTVSPTSTPTSPKTGSPTNKPTDDTPKSPSNFPIANEHPSDWFDYNPSSKYGPNEWHNIELTTDNFYFNYIKVNTNECSKDDEQSPIDLIPNGDCMDDHSPGQDVSFFVWNWKKLTLRLL